MPPWAFPPLRLLVHGSGRKHIENDHPLTRFLRLAAGWLTVRRPRVSTTMNVIPLSREKYTSLGFSTSSALSILEVPHNVGLSIPLMSRFHVAMDKLNLHAA